MARPANITESEGSGGDFRKMIQLDALIVGTGFAGMYMLYRLRSLGLKVLAVDEASGVGGTWYWNRYPGARCDVESMEYSYSFSEELQQEWEWSDRYSVQPEILEYANHVADKFNLRSLIRFNSRITSAHYDEDYQSWDITTEGGEIYKAKYCVMATGTLSSVNNPKFDGWESFQGDWYVTGRWPHSNVDFAGKTVGIIGTGSSAVQAIPVIAGQAKHLTVFQRTPNYSIPANNRPLDSQEVSKFKRDYSSTREKARQNRAGIASMVVGNKSVLEVTEEVWDWSIDLNLKGVYFHMQEAAKFMIKQGSGTIINIASVAGIAGGMTLSPPYAASKAAIINLTKVAAAKMAGHGITVNSVAPGIVDTAFNWTIDSEIGVDQLNMKPGEQLTERAAPVPLGRISQPEDVSNVVAFLASPDASYITGETIVVSGGLVMR